MVLTRVDVDPRLFAWPGLHDPDACEQDADVGRKRTPRLDHQHRLGQRVSMELLAERTGDRLRVRIVIRGSTIVAVRTVTLRPTPRQATADIEMLR